MPNWQHDPLGDIVRRLADLEEWKSAHDLWAGERYAEHRVMQKEVNDVVEDLKEIRGHSTWAARFTFGTGQ